MSLDIDLISETKIKKKPSSGIFIRENGKTKEISEKEWDKRFPGREPVKFLHGETDTKTLYSDNITHNLGNMADAAGIYEAMWYPEKLKATKAKELVGKLKTGLKKLKSNPEKFKKLNPANGWGNYDILVQFTENYLKACKEFPEAKIEVSR